MVIAVVLLFTGIVVANGDSPQLPHFAGVVTVGSYVLALALRSRRLSLTTLSLGTLTLLMTLSLLTALVEIHELLANVDRLGFTGAALVYLGWLLVAYWLTVSYRKRATTLKLVLDVVTADDRDYEVSDDFFTPSPLALLLGSPVVFELALNVGELEFTTSFVFALVVVVTAGAIILTCVQVFFFLSIYERFRWRLVNNS